jgi:hypothetical protein
MESEAQLTHNYLPAGKAGFVVAHLWLIVAGIPFMLAYVTNKTDGNRMIVVGYQSEIASLLLKVVNLQLTIMNDC